MQPGRCQLPGVAVTGRVAVNTSACGSTVPRWRAARFSVTFFADKRTGAQHPGVENREFYSAGFQKFQGNPACKKL